MPSAPRVFSLRLLAAILCQWSPYFVVLCALATPETLPAFSGSGSGTAADPYAITNVTQLQEMAASPAAYYVLANDIDATSTSLWNDAGTSTDTLEGFLPVGTATTTFTGSLDGAGHKITGLWIDRQTSDGIGLFGQVGGAAAIRNVTLEGVTVKGFSFTGALAGILATAQTVSNCHAASGTVTGDTSVGGLAGENHAPMYDCSGGASAEGRSEAGGLIGSHYGASVTRCHAMGGVTGLGGFSCYGGLVGRNYGGVLEQCYATGAVRSFGMGGDMGGLIGRNEGTAIGCYATGSCFGYGTVGGLAGENTGALTRCHATGATSAFLGAGGLAASNYGSIEYCHASGAADGDHGSGGLVSYNAGPISNSYATGAVSSHTGGSGFVSYNDGTIARCYSVGPVSAAWEAAAGFVGSNSGTVTDSFWDIEASGVDTSVAGVGKSTADMMRQRTFDRPWDFASVWGILENKTYPFFVEDGPCRPTSGPAVIGVSPCFQHFGAWLVNHEPGASGIVAIYNMGGQPLTLQWVGLAGQSDQFSIASDTGQDVLTSGAARVIQVAFDPTAPSTKTAALLILCDDPDEPVAAVSLQGVGLDAAAMAARIVAHLLGAIPLAGAELTRADVNGDSRVDVADLAALGLLSGAAPPRKVDRGTQARLDRPQRNTSRGERESVER